MITSYFLRVSGLFKCCVSSVISSFLSFFSFLCGEGRTRERGDFLFKRGIINAETCPFLNTPTFFYCTPVRGYASVSATAHNLAIFPKLLHTFQSFPIGLCFHFKVSFLSQSKGNLPSHCLMISHHFLSFPNLFFPFLYSWTNL